MGLGHLGRLGKVQPQRTEVWCGAANDVEKDRDGGERNAFRGCVPRVYEWSRGVPATVDFKVAEVQAEAGAGARRAEVVRIVGIDRVECSRWVGRKISIPGGSGQGVVVEA